MEVYYEWKKRVLQSVVFINRVGGIIHYPVLLFHKRLNQDVGEGLFGVNF